MRLIGIDATILFYQQTELVIQCWTKSKDQFSNINLERFMQQKLSKTHAKHEK